MNTQELKTALSTVLDEFTRLLHLFSDEQLNASQGEGRWTAGQLAQHVVLASQTHGPLPAEPASRPFDMYEPEIRELFLNQQLSMPSPGFIYPELISYTLSDLVKDLKWNKHTVTRYIDENDLTEIVLGIELPGWGCLSRYEWLILMRYHIQRHTGQLHAMGKTLQVPLTAYE